MFSFLTPALFWLAPLLAVPLAIALMGRAQPKTRDFPSLLPVRESLQRAMRKHRLKNWLQLILRTLAILFLLLAAAGPVWRGHSLLQPPGSAILLLHNGAYAALPSPGTGEPLFDQQNALHRQLDSLTGGNTYVERLIPDEGIPGATVGKNTENDVSMTPFVARFGSPAEGYTRLLHNGAYAARRSGRQGTLHVFVPIFDTREADALAKAARPWLEAHPEARLIVTDYGSTAARLRAFGPVVADFTKEGMVTLHAPSAAAQQPPRWSTARTQRPASVKTGGGVTRVEVVIPLSEQRGTQWISGTFTLQDADSARNKVAFASVSAVFRVPPPATLCHVGPRGAAASLATLGEGGQRLRIRSLVPENLGMTTDWTDCKLLYLANPPNADAALLARAAAVIRSGGKVILETGPHTDPVLWNRNLLVPLGLGRLTVAGPVAASRSPVAAYPVAAGLATVGIRAERWGAPGKVTTAFGFQPATGTTVLLTTESRTGDALKGTKPLPLLVERAVGGGEILLWTTSLSEPTWSDIGLGPWAALAHQAILAKAWAAGIESRSIDTDSQLVIADADKGEGEDVGEGTLRVFGPQGDRFREMRGEPGGWILGPFNRQGVYRVESAHDTTWFAATLAEPPPPFQASDRVRFRELLGETAGRQTLLLDADEDWRKLYGGVRLRSVLLGIAALLLFAEGVVSLRLTNLSNLTKPPNPSEPRKY